MSPARASTARSFDIDTSTNALWCYLVEHATERSDNERGLWYVNKAQTTPSSVRYDAPGSWRPFLYLDNRDARRRTPTRWRSSA
jgi:hypothetical protein